jgi:molybdopterin synthase sulfur carrier subunit
MATFRIPPVLRPLTDERVEVEAAGDTLGAAFEQLFTEYPDLKSRVIGGDGQLRRFVNVYVDDEDVRTLEGLRTALEPKSSVILLPAMAGGAR